MINVAKKNEINKRIYREKNQKRQRKTKALI